MRASGSRGTARRRRRRRRRLAAHGLLEEHLAGRLTRAAGFRDLLVHACADLDLARVHAAARSGPPDLQAFAAALLHAEGLTTR